MNNLCLLNYMNDVFLYASLDDPFIQSLPATQSIFELETKKISHSHINFLMKIIELFQNKNDIIFIDVGAYIGAISLLLSNHLNKQNILCQFYLFEPNPKNLECIELSIIANNIQNVTVSNKGISSNIGKTSFYTTHNSYVTGRIGHGDQEYEIEISTLDQEFSFVNKNLIIKIDTEGHEPKVLRGAIDLLNHNNCILILEIHPFCLNINVTEQEDFFEFISNRFNMIATENIGYPKHTQIINSREQLVEHCTRGGITDLVCIPKNLNYDYLR